MLRVMGHLRKYPSIDLKKTLYRKLSSRLGMVRHSLLRQLNLRLVCEAINCRYLLGHYRDIELGSLWTMHRQLSYSHGGAAHHCKVVNFVLFFVLCLSQSNQTQNQKSKQTG